MTVRIEKTSDNTVLVADLESATYNGEERFPTYLVTQAGGEVGTAGSPFFVAAGAGVTIPVSAVSLPLPTGAATASKQDAGNTSLSSIDGKLPALGQALAAASVPVVLTAAQLTTLTPLSTVNAAQSGLWSVSVGSSALPTGAATAAGQASELTALQSIDGHVDGVKGSLASIDSKITACNTGAVVVSSSALPTGAATAARQDTANTSLSSIDGKLPALGQALAAASVPVVLTAAQLTTLTPLSTVSAAQSGSWSVTLGAGTASIGKLAANGGTVIGDVNVATAPARAATTDTITAKLATDAIQNGTTALTPKFATIAAASSGNNTIVAAVTSKKIRVLGWNMVANGAVNAKWQSGAGGTDLTGLYYCAAAGGGISVPFNPVGWFETGSNTLLNLNLSGAVAVGGCLVYVEV